MLKSVCKREPITLPTEIIGLTIGVTGLISVTANYEGVEITVPLKCGYLSFPRELARWIIENDWQEVPGCGWALRHNFFAPIDRMHIPLGKPKTAKGRIFKSMTKADKQSKANKTSYPYSETDNDKKLPAIPTPNKEEEDDDDVPLDSQGPKGYCKNLRPFFNDNGVKFERIWSTDTHDKIKITKPDG